MDHSTREHLAEVTAAIVAERLGNDDGFGLFVENLPAFDTQRFVDELARRVDGKHVRLALLGVTRSFRTKKNVVVTTSPTEANRWRNDATAKEGVPSVVVVIGHATKVNSLRTAYKPIGQADLRKHIVASAIALFPTPERTAFWTALGELRSEIPLQLLADFSTAIAGLAGQSSAKLMESEWSLVSHLGLIPQKALLTSPGSRSAHQIIQKNRAYARGLRSLTTAQRSLLSRRIDNHQTGADERQTAEHILKYERSGDSRVLSALNYEVVQAVLRPETEKGKDSTEDEDKRLRPRRERLEGDALALQLLLDDSKSIKSAAKKFQSLLDPDADTDSEPESVKVEGREIEWRGRVGTRQAIGLFGRMLSGETWGGVIEAPDAVDYVSALKLLGSGHLDVTEFRPTEEHNLTWMLQRAVAQGLSSREVLEAWNRYAEARANVLDFAGALIDQPLLVLGGNEKARKAVRELVDRYGEFVQGIQTTAQQLRKSGSVEPAKRLYAFALVLDIVFVRASGEWSAIAAPTHPFHLWRWLTLAEAVSANREELKSIGEDALSALVLDPPAASPDVVLSPFALQGRLARAVPFVPVGTFGALPLFGEPSARQSAKFRARALARVLERFVRLLPHASFGLRVLLIDPPSLSGAIEDLLSLRSPFDDETIPLHVVVARTRSPREVTDEEDEDLSQVAREISDNGGSLDVMPVCRHLSEVASQVGQIQPHLTAVFDPGEAQELRIALTAPPALSPFVIPRAYRYDAFDDRLDVVIAGEEGLFGPYHDLFCEILDLPKSDYVGRRSGASRFSRDLEVIARDTMWLVVLDQAVEPTLRVGGAVRLDWRTDAGRDVLTYSAHHETVEELVADAVRLSGLKPTDRTVSRALTELLQLSGEAILGLAKPRPDVSIADRRIAKGVIGVVAAARWYGRLYPESVVISLDEQNSRRWILGANSDDRQGDLLAVRLTSDGVTVECIEVKTREETASVLRIHGGRAEGHAVVQVDQTIALLRKVFAQERLSVLDRARKDILKDQLYRAIASRNYAADRRARFVLMLEDLFENGPKQVNGVLALVKIESGTEATDHLVPSTAVSPAGNTISIAEIVESELVTSVPITKPSPKSSKASAGRAKGAGKNPVRGLPPKETSAKDSARKVSFLIGQSASGGEVRWEPTLPTQPLNNFGLLVTGDPGSGKTQILRALISELATTKTPVCIFDFKNDYSSSDFSGQTGLEVFDVDRDGLPFNPLALIADNNGETRPISHIHGTAAILKRIFHLGDQQEAQLKRAMQRAYELAGIKVNARLRLAELGTMPAFDDVVNLLVADGKQSASLLNRLSPLFDLGLFPSSDAAPTTFEDILSSAVVLDLHRLPDDRIKAAMAEFLIVRLHAHVLRGDQPRELRRMLVFDEAWRIKDSERLQELAREGRAFGVGIAIGTQFPGDIPETLSGNLASQLLLHNSEVEHRKSVARTLVGTASGPVASQIMAQTQALKKHEGFFRNQQYSPYVLVTTVPHFARSK